MIKLLSLPLLKGEAEKVCSIFSEHCQEGKFALVYVVCLMLGSGAC